MENEREKTSEEWRKLLHGLRIAVVDDNSMNIELLKFVLEDAGIFMDCFHSGIDCMEHLLNCKAYDYAAVLMDIRMPGMDGREAARAIRTSKKVWLQELPIIGMSADLSQKDRRRNQESGINESLEKPIRPSQLYETLFRYRKAAVKIPIGRRAKDLVSFAENVEPVSVQNLKTENDKGTNPMTVEEFYTSIGGDYQSAVSTFKTDERICKYVKRYIEDPAYQRLCDAAEKGDIREAFEAVHILKGLSGTFFLNRAYYVISELVEQLRPQNAPINEELLQRVRDEQEQLQMLAERITI